jgi:hypothetical protein
MTTLNQWYAACLFIVVTPNEKACRKQTDRVDLQEDTTNGVFGNVPRGFPRRAA